MDVPEKYGREFKARIFPLSLNNATNYLIAWSERCKPICQNLLNLSSLCLLASTYDFKLMLKPARDELYVQYQPRRPVHKYRGIFHLLLLNLFMKDERDLWISGCFLKSNIQTKF